MFLLNSRLDLFSAAHSHEHPFSLSYGVNLPSSLTTLLPLALESSSCPPVSVCGTGSDLSTHSFSRLTSRTLPAHSQSLATGATNARLYALQVSLCLNLRRPRNFYRVCIGYAFRPHLSSRLTRSGRTCLLKPQTFGHYDSHIILATHSGILSRVKSTTAYAVTSPLTRRSPTPDTCVPSPSFGTDFSPVEFSAHSHSVSELLRTLLMSGCF